MSYKRRLSFCPGLAMTALFGAGLLTMALPNQAVAATAANAVIANIAKVTYDDAGSNPRPPVFSSPCNVTVSLKAVNPTLTVDFTTGTAPSNAAKAYTYTLTNKSNGPDSFNLTRAASNVDAAITLGGSDPVLSTATITNLGATTVISRSGLVITVPSDGAVGNGVNYIAVGNTVMIGANTYAVTAIDDQDTGTSTITVSDPVGTLAANAVAGAQIGEQATFTSTCTPVTTTDGKTYDVNATATSAGDGTKAATSATTTTTVTLAVLTVTKYVRNISDTSTCTGGTPLTTFDTGLGAGAGSYCTTGVTGKPGEIMEYVIKVTNGGSTVANNVIITDPIPAYTTKVTDTIALGAASGAFAITGTDAGDGDFAKLDGSVTTGTVNIYAGIGGVDGNAGSGTGGTLAAGATTYGAFQVTID